MHKSLIAGLSLAASLGAQAAPELQFTPGSTSVAVGHVFDVVLRGLSFGQTDGGLAIDNLSGGQNLAFSYDATVLELVQITLDPRWTFGANVGTHNAALGSVTGLRFGVFPATTDDSFDIASFKLKALAPGQGKLDLISGSFSGRVGGKAGVTFGAMLGEVTVAVTAVPEPAALLLWLAGLGGLAALRRSDRLGACPPSPQN